MRRLSPSQVAGLGFLVGSAFFLSKDPPQGAPPARPAELQTQTITSRSDLIEVTVQLPSLRILSPSPASTSSVGNRVEFKGANGFLESAEEEIPVLRQYIAVPDADRLLLQADAIDVETIKDVRLKRRETPSTKGPPLGLGGERAWARIVGIEHARGQALALVEIAPVRYDHGRRRIQYPREVRLRLKPVQPRGPVAVNAGPLQSTLSAIVPNLDGVSFGPGSLGTRARVSHSAGQVFWCETDDDDWQAAAGYISTSCAADYLMIIADELFENEADSLIEDLALKRAEFNGFNVAIVRMGQIDSTPLTSSFNDVKALIDSVYSSASAAHMGDGKLGFVLLVGDVINPAGSVILPTHVPVPGDYEGKLVAGAVNGADGWYTLLDGPVDLVPDLLIGRLPVDADEQNWEFVNVTDKTVNYEPISASDSWTEKVLLMSGGSDSGFTFQTEGLGGFQAFFDDIEGLYPESGRTFEQLHRLTPGNSDFSFSQEVCDSIAAGFGVVGLFDHANPVSFSGAFYPMHYDTLQNVGKPSLFLSIGSYSGFHDRLDETTWCCPSTAYGGACMAAPNTSIDDCDVISERLLVQPAGAIGVVAYPRTHQPRIVQQVFANVFRALLQHKQSRLGDLVFATKLLSVDSVTSEALNLLGDPALDIGYQFDTVVQDSIDLAVTGLSMSFSAPSLLDFAPSSESMSLDVSVLNNWKHDAMGVPVEVWNGPPDEAASELLDDVVLAAVAAHDSVRWTASIGSFVAGDHDIYVSVDPDNTLDDPIKDNNVSWRTLHVRDYATGFPKAIVGQAVTVVDALLESPRKLEIAVDASIYDSEGERLPNSGLGGIVSNFYRTDKRHAVRRENYIGAPVNGTAMRIVEVGTAISATFTIPGNVAAFGVVDHGLPDSMLVVVLTQDGSQRKISLHTWRGDTKWARQIGNSVTASSFVGFSFAVGDISGDGVSDIAYAFSPQDILGLGSVPDSLGVLDGRTGSPLWAVETGNQECAGTVVRLVDIENDGVLSLMTNTRVDGIQIEDRIRCYSNTGSLMWELVAGEVSEMNPPTTFFAPMDTDHDGTKEIVFARGGRLAIVSASGGTASIVAESTAGGDSLYVSPPLAVDVDGDDNVEVIILQRLWSRYLNEYSMRLCVFNGDLAFAFAPLDYRWTMASGNPVEFSPVASAGDIDGDGKIEVVFGSSDGLLHAVRVGSTAGREDWASAAGNAMGTGLYEQVLAGTYGEPVAISGRARVLSTAIFEEGLTVTAPSDIQVGTLDSVIVEERLDVRGCALDSVRIRIDELETAGSRWGGVFFQNGVATGNISHAVVTNGMSGITNGSPLAVADSRLTSFSIAGLITNDSLWVEDTVVESCDSVGVSASGGASVWLSNSTIRSCQDSGLLVTDESFLSASASLFDGTEIGIELARKTGSWVKAHVSDCTVTDAEYGIRVVDSGDSLVVVEDCEIETSKVGIHLENAAALVDGVSIEADLVGITAMSGTVGTVTESAVRNSTLYGLIAYDDVDLNVLGTSFRGHNVGISLSAADGDWVKATIRQCVLDDNLDGIWVGDTGDSSVTIQQCEIDSSATSGIIVDSGSATLRGTTITKGTIGVHADGSAPKVGPHNTIQYNTVGVTCEHSATAVVESCLITQNTYAVTVRTGSNPDLGHATGGVSTGYNVFTPTTSLFVHNNTSNTVSAENNYWPASPPTICTPLGTKIAGPVDADPAVCTPPPAFLVLDRTVVAEEQVLVPQRFEMSQNFPNPFNPVTTITYGVPDPGAKVEIVIYDVTGRRVVDLVRAHRTPGRYRMTWDGHNSRGEPVSSGVYFIRMRAGAFVETRKLHLLR